MKYDKKRKEQIIEYQVYKMLDKLVIFKNYTLDKKLNENEKIKLDNILINLYKNIKKSLLEK